MKEYKGTLCSSIKRKSFWLPKSMKTLQRKQCLIKIGFFFFFSHKIEITQHHIQSRTHLTQTISPNSIEANQKKKKAINQ